MFCLNPCIGLLSIDHRACQHGKSLPTDISNALYRHFFVKPDWSKRSFNVTECSQKGLEEVPKQAIPSSVEVLILDQNHLRKISADDFTFMNNLIFLHLANNCQKVQNDVLHSFCKTDLYIEPEAFIHLPKLLYLSLAGNFLREFPQNLPSSLLFLDITETFLGNITSALKKNAANLKGISMGFNCYVVENLCFREFSVSSFFSDTYISLDLVLNNWKKVPTYLLHSNLLYFAFSINPVTRIFKNDFKKAPNLKLLQLRSMIGDTSANFLTLEEGVFDPLIHLQVLDISENYLGYIPAGLFRCNTKLEELNLSMNNLFKTIYDPKYLSHLKFLRYLDVSSNAPNYIIKCNELHLGPSYSNLTALEALMVGYPPSTHQILVQDFIKLSVHFDRINEQSISTLSTLSNFSSISISGLFLKSLDPNQWKKLRNLKSLYAMNNNVSYFKTNIASPKFSSEKYQLLKRNLTTRIDHSYITKHRDRSTHTNSQLIAVEENNKASLACESKVLNLTKNNIRQLVKSFAFLLEKACVIDLSDNKITHIYESDFEYFTFLEILILDRNPLHAVDSNAFKSLTHLRELQMVDTAFSLSPLSNISFLLQLSVNLKLRWKDDYLYEIFQFWQPAKYGWFDIVKSLDLSENTMTLLWQTKDLLKGFRNLVNLRLRNNEITDSMISIPILSHGNSLSLLDLGANELGQMPNKSVNLPNLATLILDHNRISVLQGKLAEYLPSLKVFIISYNEITHVQTGFFAHSQLIYLDIQHNSIARLGQDILSIQVLRNLKYLDIRSNEVDCTCGVWEIFYFWSILDKTNQTSIPGFLPKCTPELVQYDGGCIDCHSPYQLRGLSLLLFEAHRSCAVTNLLIYAMSFSSVFFLFGIIGSVGNSKWLKRFIFRNVNEHFREQSVRRGTHRPEIGLHQDNVFLIYDVNNVEIGDWVDHCLFNAMENGNPSISLKIIGRDDSCGMSPTQNLLRRIIGSRKSILILTKTFCFTSECR